MIISASRRTDIPAFYSKWFMNRVRAGFCTVPNPFNPTQVSAVSLGPENVDVIVFWTKNARPMLEYCNELDRSGYRYYYQFTLNGYPGVLEPGMPPLDELIDTFRGLASIIGPNRVVWRYDPIVLSDLTPESYHAERFSEIAGKLAGSTTRVVISLLDMYRKVEQRLVRLEKAGAVRVTPILAPPRRLLATLASVAAEHGMEIVSCAEPFDLTDCGIGPGKCVDDDYIKAAFGIDVTHTKDPAQRRECGCVRSKDIGAFNTCVHGCAYCYANADLAAVQRRFRLHDPESPSLAGWHIPVET
ncbi:MAG: DUF1848 domain-containing protein [Firmicutes bacterium]|nr:DUF1848 domain-containing protein [Bacillota bacterium]